MMSSTNHTTFHFVGFFLLFLSVLANKVSAEHPCACEAEELDFTIDCDIGENGGANRAVVLAAVEALRSDNCAENCDSPECTKNFYIVQSHHDYCPEDVIPQPIEDDIHDYEAKCKHCKISRKPSEDAPPCPPVNCTDTSGNEAYGTLSDVPHNCFDDCNNDACKTPYLYLKTVHDVCPHDTLEQAAEEGLHDWEGPCAMHLCNVEGAKDDQLVCKEEGDDHDGHDHGHSDSDHGDEEGEEHHSDDNTEPAVPAVDSSAGSPSLVATASVLSIAAIGLLVI